MERRRPTPPGNIKESFRVEDVRYFLTLQKLNSNGKHRTETAGNSSRVFGADLKPSATSPEAQRLLEERIATRRSLMNIVESPLEELPMEELINIYPPRKPSKRPRRR